MSRMCFQVTRRANNGIKRIVRCSLHEDIFSQNMWMIAR